jgi:hypothetical protein
MKEKKRKLTLRKEEIVNLSNLSSKNVVGGTEATGTPRRPGGRVEPCDTQGDCMTVYPCSEDGVTTDGRPTDDKEVTQQS